MESQSFNKGNCRRRTVTNVVPRKEDKFTFGLWTAHNVGRDPFGDAGCPALDPLRSVAKLAELGAWGVNFHDNDLVPFDASPTERDQNRAALQAGAERTRPGRADDDDQLVMALAPLVR
jgi:hypothetical protein